MTSPAPASPPYRILTVCTGNICRSPMAEVVLNAAFAEAGLADAVVVSSAGTSDEEHGNPIDRRARSVLTSAGYDVPTHHARPCERAMVAGSDLVLAMTAAHARWLRRLAAVDAHTGRPGDRHGHEAADRIHLYRSFDPDAPPVPPGGSEAVLDIADPWYGDREDFEVTLAEIQAAAPAIVAHVRSHLTPR